MFSFEAGVGARTVTGSRGAPESAAKHAAWKSPRDTAPPAAAAPGRARSAASTSAAALGQPDVEEEEGVRKYGAGDNKSERRRSGSSSSSTVGWGQNRTTFQPSTTTITMGSPSRVGLGLDHRASHLYHLNDTAYVLRWQQLPSEPVGANASRVVVVEEKG